MCELKFLETYTAHAYYCNQLHFEDKHTRIRKKVWKILIVLQ